MLIQKRARTAWCAVLGAMVTYPVLLQQPPTTTGVVAVYGGGFRAPVVGLGFVVSPSRVIGYLPSNLPDRVMVADSAGNRVVAQRLAYDSRSGLALLDVELALDPYPFAQGMAGPGEAVLGATRAGDAAMVTFVAGTVAQLDQSGASDPFAISHSATVEGQLGFGGPLLNECGEVIGVIAGNGDSAVPAAVLSRLFASPGLEPTSATSPCSTAQAQPDEAEQAVIEAEQAAAEEAAIEAEQAAAAAEQPVLEAQEDLRMAEQIRREAELTAEEIRREAEESARRAEESLRQAGQRAIDSLQAILEVENERRIADSLAAEAQRAEQTRDSLQRVEDSLRAQSERAAHIRDSLRSVADSLRAANAGARPLRWIIAAVAALVTFGLSFWIFGLRTKMRTGRERPRSGAVGRIGQAGAEDESVDDQPPVKVPSVFLDGADDDGKRVAVRVPGSVIDSSSGAVVGRHPYGSTIVLDHPEVSRRHFRLTADGGRILIEDLQSTNGTEVGNVPLRPGTHQELQKGESLRVGSLALRVTIGT